MEKKETEKEKEKNRLPVQQPNYMANNNNRRRQTSVSVGCSSPNPLNFPIFRPFSPLASCCLPFGVTIACQLC